MKKQTLVAAMLLSSTILGAVVAGAAEPTSTQIDTKAHVKFTQQTETDPTDPDPENPDPTDPDPENPDPTDPDPIDPTDPEEGGEGGGETPEVDGPLAILFAPNFEFGEHVLAAKDLNVPAHSKITSGGGVKQIPHFVQVKDVRGTHKGWTLTVKATKLAIEGDETSALNGGIIKLTDGEIKAPNGNGEVTTDMTEIKLDGSDEQTVMTAAEKMVKGSIH